VAICLHWSHENNVHPTIRSGGHSYAGFSTTRSLLIDMKRLKQIEKRPGGLVRIGGGALNRDVYAGLKAMNATVTHGRCDAVGAAGFLLGGGIGFNMRHYGVGSDLLHATDVVKADGSSVTATATDNKDLFWACNGGGGGNFGVNTSFTLAVQEIKPVTVFNLSWSHHPRDVPARLLATMLETLRFAPDAFGSKISVAAPSPEQRRAGEDVHIGLLGQLMGPRAALDDILAPIFKVARPDRVAPGDRKRGIHEMPYWDAQTDFLSEAGGPALYQEKSRFYGGKLAETAIEQALGFARALPGNSRKPSEFKFFQTGGKMNKPAATDTAFVHRSSDWLFDVEVNWESGDVWREVEANLDWQAAFYEAMGQYMPDRCYQNFPDPTLGRNWAQAYYGENLDRLKAVKKAFDGGGLFEFDQSIPVG
jgi:FAD/FMN-containing dehydrogenase